jgi:hypothetical protein
VATAEPDLVERFTLQACTRRGAAIDLVAQRGREQRSQIVYTRARGRDVVFWQSPRTRKKRRNQLTRSTLRCSQADLGLIVGRLAADLMIGVEKCFDQQGSHVTTSKAVEHTPPVAIGFDETGQPELRQVLAGDGRPAIGDTSQGGHVQLVLTQRPEHPYPRRLGEEGERHDGGVHLPCCQRVRVIRRRGAPWRLLGWIHIPHDRR